MTDGRTYWYLDQTAMPLCGHGEQRVYTDHRRTYVHCPTCDKSFVVGDFGATYSVHTEQSKEAKL